MTKQRVPFHSLTSDLDDDIERLAAAKGVATMVKPMATSSASSSSSPMTASMATRGGEGVTLQPDEVSPTVARPRGKLKGINLEVPDYVWTDLKIRAAHAQTSVRHIIMKALRANGIVIADDDMVEDGRRLRS